MTTTLEQRAHTDASQYMAGLAGRAADGDEQAQAELARLTDVGPERDREVAKVILGEHKLDTRFTKTGKARDVGGPGGDVRPAAKAKAKPAAKAERSKS